MKKKILELLQNCQDFISGQEISEKFGVSRTAVWKAIRQLEAEGYVIEAVRNKGYRLKEEPDLLTEEQLQKYLETDWAGQHLVVFDEIMAAVNYGMVPILPTIRQNGWQKKVQSTVCWCSAIVRLLEKDAGDVPGIPKPAKVFL